MSWPRLGRSVAERPSSLAYPRNLLASAFEVAEKPVSVQLNRSRFRW